MGGESVQLSQAQKRRMEAMSMNMGTRIVCGYLASLLFLGISLYVCLTGFNLAMVIQMLQYDGDDLHELAEDIASIGKDVSIRLIPKIIPEEEQND